MPERPIPPERSEPGYDLFLSYAHGDGDRAERLHELLEARGLRVWKDDLDARPGRELHDELGEAIARSGWFLVLGTARYARSWTGWETGQAERMRRKKRVIVLQDEGAELPGTLLNLVTEPIDLDAGGDWWSCAVEVVEALVRGGDVGEVRRRHRAQAREAADAPGQVPERWRERLERYLEHMRNWFDRDQPALDLQARTLQEVYVTCAAEPSRERTGEQPADIQVPEGRRTSLDSLVQAWPSGCFTLRGDPGAGKTTALRWLVYLRAGRALEDLRRRGRLAPASVPVWIAAANLDGADLPTAWREACREMDDTLHEALRWAVDRGLALLLVDGLDEVRPEAADGVVEALRDWTFRHRRTPLVLTSRRFGYRQPSSRFAEFDLCPLAPPDRLALLRNRGLSPPQAEQVARQLEGTPEAGNPLHLALVAWLLKQRLAAGAPADPLPTRRSRLLSETLTRLLPGGGRERDPVLDIPPDTLRTELRELALDLLRQGAGPTWSRDEIREALARRPDLQHAARPDQDLLADLVHDTGLLLRRQDPAGTCWSFWHRSLAEQLAAEALAARPTARVLSLARDPYGRNPWWRFWRREHPGQVGRWAEVFALYGSVLAGRGEDVGPFFRRLLRKRRELALRAMTLSDLVPIRELLAEAGLVGEFSARFVREMVFRAVEHPAEREPTIDFLVKRARQSTDDPPQLQIVAAALLALGAEEALGAVRADLDDPSVIGIPEKPWAEIPAGKFVMGSPEGEEGRWDAEGPQHEVRIAKPFLMLATPVTQALYLVVTGENPSTFSGDLRRPVERVKWTDARRFCSSWSKVLGMEVRLPREAEWEYACRAGTTTRYWSGNTGDDLDRVGWYGGNSGDRTHPVGEKAANAWGLYDVHGNVDEWCVDGWESDYERHREGRTVAPSALRSAGDGASARVVRGGSYWSEARRARSAFRNWNDRWSDWNFQGFRVLLPQALDP